MRQELVRGTRTARTLPVAPDLLLRLYSLTTKLTGDNWSAAESQSGAAP